MNTYSITYKTVTGSHKTVQYSGHGPASALAAFHQGQMMYYGATALAVDNTETPVVTLVSNSYSGVGIGAAD